jgi:hypothetical protein
VHIPNIDECFFVFKFVCFSLGTMEILAGGKVRTIVGFLGVFLPGWYAVVPQAG